MNKTYHRFLEPIRSYPTRVQTNGDRSDYDLRYGSCDVYVDPNNVLNVPPNGHSNNSNDRMGVSLFYPINQEAFHVAHHIVQRSAQFANCYISLLVDLDPRLSLVEDRVINDHHGSPVVQHVTCYPNTQVPLELLNSVAKCEHPPSWSPCAIAACEIGDKDFKDLPDTYSDNISGYVSITLLRFVVEDPTVNFSVRFEAALFQYILSLIGLDTSPEAVLEISNGRVAELLSLSFRKYSHKIKRTHSTSPVYETLQGLIEKNENKARSLSSRRKYLLFVGNPGVGKSLVLNSLIGKILFKSGLSFGSGLTQVFQCQEHNGINYLDSPGLDDIEKKEQAADEINKALKLNGEYRVIFIVTLESGRVKASDIFTMEAILGAIEIKDIKYGIIVNKLSKKLLETIKHNPEAGVGIYASLNVLDKFKTDHIHYILDDPKARDENDQLMQLETGLVNFIEHLPTNKIVLEDVKPLDITNYQKKCEELEKQLEEAMKNQFMVEEYYNYHEIKSESGCTVM